MRAIPKRNSIYTQLLLMLAVSLLLAGVTFFCSNWLLTKGIDYYCTRTDYVKNKNSYYIEKLQSYISENEVASTDTEKLADWVKKEAILSLSVYKDGLYMFDSEYPDQLMWQDNVPVSQYDWEEYYSIQFSDGTATAAIWGVYGYRLTQFAYCVELLLAFAVFLLVLLAGVHKKMKYISKLSDEIEILKGGSLEYQIVPEGNDELTVLAEGLESMRRSFLESSEKEARIMQENQKIVTEMSHDIRTPITSIMLYTEILKTKKYQDEAQLNEYIEKIDQKSRRLKQLAENLFEYSLITGETEIEMEEPENYEILFYDLFSETCNYLEQRGYQVQFEERPVDACLQVYTEYVARIVDNITSNILKYADKKFPVKILTVYDREYAGFAFENTVSAENDYGESTKVGIQSISSMMKKMNGSCRVTRDDTAFRIEILFPVV